MRDDFLDIKLLGVAVVDVLVVYRNIFSLFSYSSSTVTSSSGFVTALAPWKESSLITVYKELFFGSVLGIRTAVVDGGRI